MELNNKKKEKRNLNNHTQTNLKSKKDIGAKDQTGKEYHGDLKQELGLYIHIPFCQRKCEYCDFLSFVSSEDIKKEYTKALRNEIYSYRGKVQEYIVKTIFIGGGTPSCIPAKDIEKILAALKEVFIIQGITNSSKVNSNLEDTVEITMEVNPGTLNVENLKIYKDSGINRLSFGLQSTNNDELIYLGRIHTYEEFLENYELARDIGFDNINVDLISALPGQTFLRFKETLQRVVDLSPEHISAYSLIIEEGTPFFDKYKDNNGSFLALPDEDTERRMYTWTKEYLLQKGYHRYEISNYAKEGYESKHNSSYWVGTPYLGFGLGSSSYMKQTRFRNMIHLEDYLIFWKERQKVTLGEDMILENSGMREEVETLTVTQQMEEFMFLGLRLSVGVSKSEFYQKFQKTIEEQYGDILKKLTQENLIAMELDRIYLTDRGVDVSNHVLSQFLI